MAGGGQIDVYLEGGPVAAGSVPAAGLPAAGVAVAGFQSSLSATRLTAYGDRGSRLEAAVTATRGGRRFTFRPAAGETRYHLVPDASFLSPARIELDRPSDLGGIRRRADYLMIAHQRLIRAIQPLADFHRRQGLAVAVVDVEDVYDEFNHGIVHPRAIRDFIAHAYHSWLRPAPRFVLLVGDASWDTKNTTVNDTLYANWADRQLVEGGARFLKKGATTYAIDPELNRRGLIPTWNHVTRQGHSASDNYFVQVEGGDHLPDLEIGRLPVVEPEEVAAIVDKIVS